ncbi:MAG TPA: pirin family protein [Candidatus Methylacidiphilales bacterium]|nr:pirin family protein [Candidatus Methylacidiphilales bacterium]
MSAITSIKRPAKARGHMKIDWLESWHTFSFGDYYDPNHEGFRELRVINEDYIAPRSGFPMHPHRNMEILTYVISGELTHRDSMGNARTVHAGQAQYMSAGSGVTHSEINDSAEKTAHILQIWIFPEASGGKPAYAEWSPAKTGPVPLTLMASSDGKDRSLTLRQNAEIYLGELQAGQTAIHATQPQRSLWLQMISGELKAEKKDLSAGDGLAIENASAFEIVAKTGARFLLFDLP